MPTPVCQLPPDSDGYQAVHGNEIIAVNLKGGPSRFRRDKEGAVAQVQVKWTCSPTNYNYLMAFYRTAINHGADVFEIDLILDKKDVDTYLAHIVPETFRLVEQRGLTYVVQATLEVIHDPPDSTADTTIITAGPDL